MNKIKVTIYLAELRDQLSFRAGAYLALLLVKWSGGNGRFLLHRQCCIIQWGHACKRRPLCEGNPSVTGWFPSLKAIYAELFLCVQREQAVKQIIELHVICYAMTFMCRLCNDKGSIVDFTVYLTIYIIMSSICLVFKPCEISLCQFNRHLLLVICINLSHCCHIFPRLRVWCGCIIICCRFPFISRESWVLLLLLLLSYDVCK